jgi:hypothetical protein
VKINVDDPLRTEAKRFVFRFSCDDCAHFDANASLCSLGYPPAPRRDALGHTHLELCKEFELT